MRFSKQLATLAVFVTAAIVAFVVGAALLMAWSMWAMMGFRPGGALLVLLAAGLVAAIAGISWLVRRGRQQGTGVGADSASPAERCPQCRTAVESAYALCPECHVPVQGTCPECQGPLKSAWTRCPYCRAEAAGNPAVRVQESEVGHGAEHRASDVIEVVRDNRR